jgi:large repetitive protein
MTGDNVGELVVAAGFGGGPRVSIWEGTSLKAGEYTSNPIPDFFVFEQNLRNGFYPALGDVNGDGRADLVAGAGPGGGPRLFVLDGSSLITKSGLQTPIANFFVGDISNRQGLTVASIDMDGDGRSEVIVNSGQNVIGYLGKTLTPNSKGIADFTFLPFPSWAGGVYVG